MSETVHVCVLSLLIVAVTATDVTFYLFTPENPSDYVLVSRENIAISNEKEIKFMIHGWSENRSTTWYEPLKNAFLADSNNVYVIEVDYAKSAAQPYLAAVKSSTSVGEEVAKFILALTAKGFPLENIDVIGHSLGGQVAGYVGKSYLKKTGKKLSKITALDPAGPFFQGLFNLNGNSLEATDAEIVYVIHTDRALFGQRFPCGTVDVFPNGGAMQPGCPDGNDDLYCSHHKSYWYYIWAIENPGSLIAHKCENYLIYQRGECTSLKAIDLRGDVRKEDTGVYYLRVSAKRPYVSY